MVGTNERRAAGGVTQARRLSPLACRPRVGCVMCDEKRVPSPHPEHDVAAALPVRVSVAVRTVCVSQFDVPPPTRVCGVHATAAVRPIAGALVSAVVVAAWNDGGRKGGKIKSR